MNRIIPRIVLMIFFTASFFIVCAQKKELSEKEIILLDSISLQDVPNAAPGIATAIIKNGEFIYSKVGGYANLEDSILINPSSRFNIASNGKQFTALAILMLAEEGKLKLTDDIRKFFPAFMIGIQKPIRIEHLLNHTSGIRDVYDLLSLQGITWWEQSLNNNDIVSILMNQRDLNFTPGSGYLYSNSNYILLAQIIERVSGIPFVKYTSNIFQQLGMKNTRFESDYLKIEEPVAKAYFNFNTWTTFKWIWNVSGDGNLFTTLEDQVAWEKILQGTNSTSIPGDILFKSQQLVNSALNKQYGYGLEFGKYKGIDYVFHEGSTGAWKATTIRFPGQKLSIVTLTNTGKSIPYNQTRQMADVVLGLRDKKAQFLTSPEREGDSVSMKEIPGIYLTENNFAFEFYIKDQELFLKRDGRNDVKLEREAANIFRQTFDKDFKQEFSKNKKGELQVAVYYTSHAPYSLKKINTDWKGFDFSEIAGTYLNSEINAEIHIQHKDSNQYYVKIGKRKNSMNGILIDPGKMLVGGYTISIKRSNSSLQLLLDGNRIKQVRFDRQ